MGIFSEPPTGAGFTKISGLLETALTLPAVLCVLYPTPPF